jgi:aromatic-amino-acid transaminase
MGEYILAEANGRVIPKRDVIFGISGMANEMAAKEGKEKVINGTVGSLLDDEGNLMILSSVVEALKELAPGDFADYAPIGGLPSFHKAVIKETFGDFVPKGYTRAVATPGGTGAIRNTIVNYSKVGDQILTSDWFWGPYHTIAQEHGRSITTFTLFDENSSFHQKAFREKVAELGETQGKVVILLNTPANNPTGFSVSDEDWDGIVKTLTEEGKKGHPVTLFVDAAYLDYAGDPKAVRQFLRKLDNLSARILIIVGYSMSKGYTLYGMRGGAMICLSSSEEIADEFKKVCEQSCRGTWSNCTRAVQALITKVHQEPALLQKVEEERATFREVLLERGRAFEQGAKECGLKIIPYDGGFFASVPCNQPESVVDELMKEGIFLVPLGKGIRVAVSALPLEKLVLLPARIKVAMDKF